MANVSTDKRPSLNILSRFYNTMAAKLKKSTYLQILTGVILHNIHQKLGKLLDFRILLDYSIICTKRVKKLLFHQKSTGIDNLTIGLLKTVVASYQNCRMT